ncbi:MAG TPA: S1/P1 nuclease [Ferruginibacter sp.]|nr:S1/P1 nuclease [Ferruginibacter sp.]
MAYLFIKKSFGKNILIAILLFFSLCLPRQSKAWGLLGHRIVGQIADAHLSKKAKKSIAEIMGNESIAMCSNWADFIKSDSSYNYLSKWHYVNLVTGLNKQQVEEYLHNDSLINIFTKVNWLVAELKKKELAKETKQFYLKLLIHFIGDMHQPMHVGRPDDQGGNRIRVLWFREQKNLHQVWDEALIDFQQLSYTEYAAAINFSTPEQRKGWQLSPISDWVFESYQYAEQIYADIKNPEEKLSYQYNFKYKSILESQLLKGGIRLAGLLNEIYK